MSGVFCIEVLFRIFKICLTVIMRTKSRFETEQFHGMVLAFLKPNAWNVSD